MLGVCNPISAMVRAGQNPKGKLPIWSWSQLQPATLSIRASRCLHKATCVPYLGQARGYHVLFNKAGMPNTSLIVRC